MPTEEERRVRRKRADQQVVRHAAAWLRAGPRRHGHAGLSRRQDTLAVAELLDVLATGLLDVAPDVQRQTVESCRVLLGGEPAPDRPARRP